MRSARILLRVWLSFLPGVAFVVRQNARVRLFRRPVLREDTLGPGVVLHGPLWVGDGTAYDDGRVVVGADGVIAAVGASADIEVPYGSLEVDVPWVGPGLYDAHVHLAFGTSEEILAGGVVAVRDLGAPPTDALRWRASTGLQVEVAGPLLTAPGGYPSKSWGSDGFAAFVDDVAQAARLVEGLAMTVDVVKLALEPRGGPVPSAAVCRAVVDAAHAAGRDVTCHALTVETVERALDAGVDELAHTPTERLPDELVGRLAESTRVVSTLHTMVRGGLGDGALANAAALVGAGAVVRYGTDLGNTGVKPGADPKELQLLARAGLGAEGAMLAATRPLQVGQAAGVVGLDGDPVDQPEHLRRPRVVVAGTTLLLRS
jgi:imidazolonepropionase-like amidohydrolase